MTVGEGIKLLKDNGFSLLNQRGSHMKFGKGNLRYTITYHSKDSEDMRKYAKNQLRRIIEQSKSTT